MLIAEAHVETRRPSRYLVQFCQHLSRVSSASAHMQVSVDGADDQAVIDFGWGRCRLYTGPDVLFVRAEAGDEASLHEIERRIANRLEGAGRRDNLTVRWSAPRNADEEPCSSPSRGRGSDMRRREHG